MEKNKKGMNLPNTLSLLRVVFVPAFMAAMIFMKDIKYWGQIVPALLFILTALTDLLDGKIARKYNLVTDFGKFIDPLADKFMVFGAMLSIIYVTITNTDTWIFGNVFIWVALVVMFRELAVTSIRLVVAGKSGIVVAASWWGKVKTMTQCIAIVVIILTPILTFFGYEAMDYTADALNYVAAAAILITTVGSGIDYFKSYMPYMDTNK